MPDDVTFNTTSQGNVEDDDRFLVIDTSNGDLDPEMPTAEAVAEYIKDKYGLEDDVAQQISDAVAAAEGLPDDALAVKGLRYHNDRLQIIYLEEQSDGTWEEAFTTGITLPVGVALTDIHTWARATNTDTITLAKMPEEVTRLATSSNDGQMSSEHKAKLDDIEDDATADQTGAEIVELLDDELGSDDWQSGGSTTTATDTADGLMSHEHKVKLDGIAEGAEVNVQADWDATTGDAQILNKPTIPTVPDALTDAEIKTQYENNADTNAFTDADHTKLDGIAEGAEVNVQADWNAASGDAHILNKPTLPIGTYDLGARLVYEQTMDLTVSYRWEDTGYSVPAGKLLLISWYEAPTNNTVPNFNRFIIPSDDMLAWAHRANIGTTNNVSDDLIVLRVVGNEVLRFALTTSNRLAIGASSPTQDDARPLTIHELTVTLSTVTGTPGPPLSLRLSVGNSQLALSWDAPSWDGGSAITAYGIETSSNGASWVTLVTNTGSTTTSYTHTGLTNGSTYYYRVFAINAHGTSGASAAVSGSPGFLLAG